MIFRNILDEKTALVQAEFDLLFEDCMKNQSHIGDMLLVAVNGQFNRDVESWTNIDPPLSPYMIGPGEEGHAENTHHQFIAEYLSKSISDQTLVEYQLSVVYDPERTKEIDVLTKSETYSIQIEMLIYLKIWESDLFIKNLYQMVRLSEGLPYDWHFAIAESNRDEGNTGNRDTIIRKKIRDRIKDKYPIIYGLIKNGFKTQIRNSIAHSKYSFLGRYIHPNNHIEKDPAAQIQSVPFDEWIDMFHNTLILQSQIVKLINWANNVYGENSKKNNLLATVRINRVVKETQYKELRYRPVFKDWGWRDNEPK